MTRTCGASLFLGAVVFQEWLQRFQDVGMDKAFACKHTTQPKIHLYSKPHTKPDGMWSVSMRNSAGPGFIRKIVKANEGDAEKAKSHKATALGQYLGQSADRRQVFTNSSELISNRG